MRRVSRPGSRSSYPFSSRARRLQRSGITPPRSISASAVPAIRWWRASASPSRNTTSGTIPPMQPTVVHVTVGCIGGMVPDVVLREGDALARHQRMQVYLPEDEPAVELHPVEDAEDKARSA